MKNKSFYILTLGCKINQYESEAIREGWKMQGLMEVSSPHDADIVLINSCAVTQMAISDTKKYIRRFFRENPNCEIIVTGCAIPRWDKEIRSIKGVKYTIPQQEKPRLIHYPTHKKMDQTFPVEDFSLQIKDYFRARPLIKIQDGCSTCCKYCIVPLTRGPSRSRDVPSILKEIRRILKKGFKEIIISGINLREFKTRYNGKDIDLWDLITLIKELVLKDFEKTRIRISSLDPSMLTKKGLETLSWCTEIVPHLHLSIQSASPKILNKMGRFHYVPEDIIKFIEELKNIWPIFGLGCDVLVGFPGEDEKDFELTYNFCKEVPFTYGHVFKYSKRPNTPAAKYKDQVPKDIKNARSLALRELFVKKKKEFLNKLLDVEHVNMVVEDDKKMIGMSEYYVICKMKNSDRVLNKGDILKVSPVSVDFSNMNLIVK